MGADISLPWAPALLSPPWSDDQCGHGHPQKGSGPSLHLEDSGRPSWL